MQGFRYTPRRGFTLAELLATIGILLVLMALSVPAFAPLVRSGNINKASSMIVDELNAARQLSLTQNRDIEVRFYKLPSKTDPGNIQFRAFRTYYPAGAGGDQAKAIGKVRYLPEHVIISGSSKYTTLLDTDLPERKGMENLPGQASAPYVSFLFRPTGRTNLAPITSTWFATFYTENAPVNSKTGLPDNYFAIQVDPVTARVRTYQP